MSDERDYMKIEIEEEEGPASEPTVYQTDSHQPPVTQRLSNAGQQAAQTARTAWESDQRQQATAALQRGAAEAAERSREVVGRAVSQQSRRRVKRGLASGAYWLSERFARLAERLMPPPKNPPEA